MAYGTLVSTAGSMRPQIGPGGSAYAGPSKMRRSPMRRTNIGVGRTGFDAAQRVQLWAGAGPSKMRRSPTLRTNIGVGTGGVPARNSASGYRQVLANSRPSPGKPIVKKTIKKAMKATKKATNKAARKAKRAAPKASPGLRAGGY